MTATVPERVLDHVRIFNRAIESGDFGEFVDGFAEGAVMDFVGVPVGPFRGKPAIRSAYESSPPDDTMSVVSVMSTDDVDTVRFRWSKGGTGTMTLRWSGDQVAGLEVAFDGEGGYEDD